MHLSEYLIDAADWADRSESRRPLGFIDLETWPAELPIAALPPYPQIGLGSGEHPLASLLDAIVESPVSAEALIRGVSQAPNAAAAAIQLLRDIEDMPADRGLLFESLCYAMLQGSGEHAAWLALRVAPEQPVPAGDVVIERRDSALHVTLDRPWAHNAIDCAMRDRLFEAFSVAAIDSEVDAVMVRAAGAAFSVGGDLDEFGTTRDPATAHLIRSRTLPALPLSGRADIVDVHVQGACIGAGLELAAFAGRVTAAPSAWFQLPELAMGLIPGAGGCVSVPRRIGRQRAALMILSGRRISAATALDWGLIDAIEDLPSADEGGANQVTS